MEIVVWIVFACSTVCMLLGWWNVWEYYKNPNGESSRLARAWGKLSFILSWAVIIAQLVSK